MCLWWYTECKSPIMVQQQFRRQYGRNPPLNSIIMRWVTNFQQTGGVKKLPQSERTVVTQQTVDSVQVAFQRSSQKSIRRASRQLHILKSIIHKVLHKRLNLQAYKLQIIQVLEPNDHPLSFEFSHRALLISPVGFFPLGIRQGSYLRHPCS
ncbi:hypothetical protein ANN_19179 [Periplaneta americana]|uniref:DUF4817 domain-containing protein n=1 Tax=Periplaneta americana TaxID=6978 RepID=A0ABQ8S9L9_PERAM|nr:hypothetical protein ANN_19179 [Periplaneta americana]